MKTFPAPAHVRTQDAHAEAFCQVYACIVKVFTRALFHFILFAFFIINFRKTTIRIIKLTVLSFHKIIVELNFCIPNGFNVNISAKIWTADMSVDAVC